MEIKGDGGYGYFKQFLLAMYRPILFAKGGFVYNNVHLLKKHTLFYHGAI